MELTNELEEQTRAMVQRIRDLRRATLPLIEALDRFLEALPEEERQSVNESDQFAEASNRIETLREFNGDALRAEGDLWP
jgi:hypothetical protein